jgi:glycosyltransferase involved in cell wall biosynthesis/SAM-dependent methyltransferase
MRRPAPLSPIAMPKAKSAKLPRRPRGKPRLLIFVVAYNAEKTIGQVLGRIPHALAEEYEVEVLVLDDSSQDRTFEESGDVRRRGHLPFPLHILFNPVNQGYGGNQKIGYHFAIEEDFDFVALVHGDGQYAPECLPDLVRPLRDGEADAVFGSRMLERGAARRGGMPLYKYVGNRILSWFQNRILQTSLSEFHSGYRVYSVDALRRIPFALNTGDFHFDTEIIIQLLFAKQRIKELPIPTYYGDEISHVNGLKYAWHVAMAVLVARSQRMGLFYDRRFDCEPTPVDHAQYVLKLGYPSPHTLALEQVPRASKVLDLGCAGGYVASLLRQRNGCCVTGVDRSPLEAGLELDRFIRHDLNEGLPSVDFAEYDYILLLDVIEHLASPEVFVERLREAMKVAPNVKLLVSTANVGFFINRVMLLLGKFNYGKRGVLDLTHTRLFTFKSFRRLFEQGGFRVVEVRALPGPFPLALGDNRLSRALLALNQGLNRLAPGLFAYQVFFVVKPLPSLEYLLREAHAHSATRSSSGEGTTSLLR